MHTLIPRLPWWYASWVGLQGDLRWLYCKWQAGHINVQSIHLVLEVSGQLMSNLLQNTGNKNKGRCLDKKKKQEMIHMQFLHHNTVSLTTVVRRLCLCAAAELAALFRSTPLPSSAALPQGQLPAHTHAVPPSVSDTLYWPPGESQLQPVPALSAL